MKYKYIWLVFCLGISCIKNTFAQDREYVVVAGHSVMQDREWMKVVKTLQQKHQAAVLEYNIKPEELLEKFRALHPRYVAIVEKPENIGRDYIIRLNKLCRQVDSDIYADFLWGIITGYNAGAAMQMVEQSRQPFIIRSAVSTITELGTGKWFDRYAWIDDHVKGLYGEKKSAQSDTVRKIIPPEQVLHQFYNLYAAYQPNLLVTASHASEKNLEMPYSLGNIRARKGSLYADYRDSTKNLIESGKRKVYFAVGNCLIGNVNNTRESMAIAWMNSGNAAAMIGYVVTTWHGRNGWGGLKYWLTTPGRYTLAEAIYLNQQDMLYQMNSWDPGLLAIDYPYGIKGGFAGQYKECADSIRKITGIAQPSKDQIGFVHDRDVLACYGDPKWDVRLQSLPEEQDFKVTSRMKGNKCIVTIRTKRNFSPERMAGNHFKEEHVLDLPFSYFFPKRLKNPSLAPGQQWKAAIDENFILIYSPGFQPGQKYQVILQTDQREE